ncbi:RNA-2',3'-PO4:RNA-5'-OH ligase [hydrothermal vent metagenome]|uniref:RNA-2',3'-PO4:RNA-5'-OH ligase n=1 Tax=hydrothermal vent metagenome TaxID=652676 RepID=A0A3B0XMV3_9ZZZZ
MLNKGKVPAKIFTDDIDYMVMRQLINILQLPIIHKHVAATADKLRTIRLEIEKAIPAAYKDIDKVMDKQSDLVEIVHALS